MVFKATWMTCSRVRMTTLMIVVMALWTTVALAGVNEDLYNAAKYGDLPEVKRLLVEGAKVNASDKDGVTALILASLMGHREIVKELLAKGAEVNARNNSGGSALIAASIKGHREIVDLLIKAGAK